MSANAHTRDNERHIPSQNWSTMAFVLLVLLDQETPYCLVPLKATIFSSEMPQAVLWGLVNPQIDLPLCNRGQAGPCFCGSPCIRLLVGGRKGLRSLALNNPNPKTWNPLPVSQSLLILVAPRQQSFSTVRSCFPDSGNCNCPKSPCNIWFQPVRW